MADEALIRLLQQGGAPKKTANPFSPDYQYEPILSDEAVASRKNLPTLLDLGMKVAAAPMAGVEFARKAADMFVAGPVRGLANLMTAPLSDVVRSGDRDAMRKAAEASFDVAGALPAAGVAAGRTMPTNAAGMGGGRLDPPLPMDKASRMARAKEMGFDDGQTWYRGTPTAGRSDSTRDGTFWSSSPRFASDYAMGLGDIAEKDLVSPGVIPAIHKGKYFDTQNPDHVKAFVDAHADQPHRAQMMTTMGSWSPERGTWANLERPEIQGWIRDNGFDGVVIREGGGTLNRLVFDGSNVRSVNAAFDPAKKNSANLLASNPDAPNTATVLAALSVMDQPGRKPQVYDGYHGSRRGLSAVDEDGEPQNMMFGTAARTPAAREVAGMYAEGGDIIPVQARFDNPYIVDAKGADFDSIPVGSRTKSLDDLVDLADTRGHDGLVVQNLVDPPIPGDYAPPTDIFAALKRGTVYDANGNLIFSNPNDPTTAAILALLTQQQGGQPQQ